MHDDKRKIALDRAKELKDKIKDYIIAKDSIPRGLSPAFEKRIKERKSRVLELFNATQDDWEDWRWQVRNRISDVNILSKIVKLSEEEILEQQIGINAKEH